MTRNLDTPGAPDLAAQSTESVDVRGEGINLAAGMREMFEARSLTMCYADPVQLQAGVVFALVAAVEAAQRAAKTFTELLPNGCPCRTCTELRAALAPFSGGDA